MPVEGEEVEVGERLTGELDEGSLLHAEVDEALAFFEDFGEER